MHKTDLFRLARNAVAWFVLFFLVVGVIPRLFGYRFVLVDVFALPSDEALATVQAAWFQALGSVAAIFAAIYIGHRQANAAAELALDDRDRRTTIEGTALIYALQGVAIEAMSKGNRAMQFATHGSYASAWNGLQAERWRLQSIELLPPLYPAVGLFGKNTGTAVAYAIYSLLPCNPTLADLLAEHGKPDLAQDAKLRALYLKLARRCYTAQCIALNALAALGQHPAMSPERLEPAIDLAWYPEHTEQDISAAQALMDAMRGDKGDAGTGAPAPVSNA